MVKTLDNECSWYEPSKRSRNWLKIKKDYLNSTACDSLDLVVIGGYFGRGKRAGVFGGFLLASIDVADDDNNYWKTDKRQAHDAEGSSDHAEDEDPADGNDMDVFRFQAICKLGTGFSEAELEQHSIEFKNLIIPIPPLHYDVTENIKPDVWFEPKRVTRTPLIPRSGKLRRQIFLFHHCIPQLGAL